MTADSKSLVNIIISNNIDLHVQKCWHVHLSCNTSTLTSTGPTSGYDDICIAVWLESTAHSKSHRTS